MLALGILHLSFLCRRMHKTTTDYRRMKDLSCSKSNDLTRVENFQQSHETHLLFKSINPLLPPLRPSIPLPLVAEPPQDKGAPFPVMLYNAILCYNMQLEP